MSPKLVWICAIVGVALLAVVIWTRGVDVWTFVLGLLALACLLAVAVALRESRSLDRLLARLRRSPSDIER